MLRVQRHAEVKAHLEQWTSRHTVDDIVARMLAAGVPASPINTIDRVVTDPHIAGAREMFVDVDHPVAGPTRLTGSHIKLSATPPRVRTASPTLGQHTENVLAGLPGMTPERMARLRAEHVV